VRKRLLLLLVASTVGLGLLALPSIDAAALDREGVRRITPAVVQLGPIFTVPDRETNAPALRSFGWGSGSIINSDGYILTNAHVADTSDLKAELDQVGGVLKEGVVAVYMTRKSDQPPVPTFVARVIATNTDLDLAIVKITVNLDGSPVDLSTLNLPQVGLGNSDDVELGDTLHIFGYPGIGGETITYTQGPVSGFASDKAIAGRAWIKTSASISGGNSGGAGIDDQGQLVGVPTRAGVEGAGGFVDCRKLADTNRDGQIDDRDTCIPTGGFLNSLRAINVGKAFIAEALQSEVPPTPSMVPDLLRPVTNESAADLPDKPVSSPVEPGPCGEPVAPDPAPTTVPTVPTVPTTEIGGDPGLPAQQVTDSTSVPSDPPVTPVTPVVVAPEGCDGAPDSTVPPASTVPPIDPVGGSSLPPPPEEDVNAAVEVIGKVMDADTGRPIEGIRGYVLAEGVEWADAKSDVDVFAASISDRNGEFRFDRALVRGAKYSIGFGADGSGYRPVTADNIVVPASGPDPLILEIRLESE
jgi:Trypsin-like peptidase domain